MAQKHNNKITLGDDMKKADQKHMDTVQAIDKSFDKLTKLKISK